jgi:predicted porin
MFQGRLTYDYKADAWTAHAWAGFVEQELDDITVPGSTTVKNKSGIGGEAGLALTFGPVGVTGYYYRASGVGTTGLFFDSIALNGELRDSEGGYIQAYVKPTDKLKIIGSYGVSSLYLASGEAAYDSYSYFNDAGQIVTVNPTQGLVRRNESETAGVYYAFTPWLTGVGEYTHAESKSHGPDNTSANSVSLGAIVFY